MKEALFYNKKEEKRTACYLCNHGCVISPGKRGLCGVRENIDGTLFSLVYGKIVAENLDPIEKKPLFHFLPSTSSYSISTVGCNFFCLHCQNWQISQYPHLTHGEITGDPRTPEDIVEAALKRGARSISYTYVEPTIFYEFARDCAILAKEKNLKNVFVSNGYMTKQVIDDMAGLIDAINIDIKSFSNKFYIDVCKAKVKPVLDNVKYCWEKGIWTEVTTLLIPELNDSEEELLNIAKFIYDISPDMPWHVSAFSPNYQMREKDRTPNSTIKIARDIGLRVGLNYVYEGNIPGLGKENTYCPECSRINVERYGFTITKNIIKDGKCGYCGTEIKGVWE